MNKGDREYPVIGVGVVVFRECKVLLIRRGKPPFAGRWSIPGGRLEFGESLESGVLRELEEETAVNAKIIGQIGVFEALPGVEDNVPFSGHVVMVDYAAEWLAGEPRAGDDATEAEFVSIEAALERLQWDETRRALEMAVALRRSSGFGV